MLRTLLAHADDDAQTDALARDGGRGFVSQALRPYLIAALLDRDPDHPAIVVAGDDRAARDLAAGLRTWLEPRTVRYYPSRGVTYESHLAPPPHLVGLRIAALDALLDAGEGAAPVVVVSAVALSEKVPDPSLRPHSFCLKSGELLDLDEVAMQLVAAGYERIDQVEDRGQFAIRGGLLDVFPATEDRAVRVDLFGDEIESLRWFSTFTQRSLGDAELVEIAPAAELAEEHRELAEIAALEQEADRPDIAELLPVEDFHPFLELAPANAGVLIAGEEDVAPALADHWQDVCAAFHDQDAHDLYVSPDEIAPELERRARIRLSSIDQDQPFQFRAQAADIAARGIKEAEPELEKLTRSGYRTIVAFARRGEGERAAYNLGRLKVAWLDGADGAERDADVRPRAAAERVHRAAVPPRRDPRAPAVPAPARRRAPGPRPPARRASQLRRPAHRRHRRPRGPRASPGSRALTRRPSPGSRATISTSSTRALTACSSRSTSSRRSAASSERAAPTRRCPSSAARAGTRSRRARAAPPRSSPASCSTCTPSASAARATPSRSTPTGSASSRTRSRSPRRPTSATRSSSSRPTWRRRGRWTA